MEVVAFRPEDITTFITQWFGQLGPQGTPDSHRVELGRQLNEELKDAIRIQTLAANPLLLSMMTLLYERRQGQLPTRRSELYRRSIKRAWERSLPL